MADLADCLGIPFIFSTPSENISFALPNAWKSGQTLNKVVEQFLKGDSDIILLCKLIICLVILKRTFSYLQRRIGPVNQIMNNSIICLCHGRCELQMAFQLHPNWYTRNISQLSGKNHSNLFTFDYRGHQTAQGEHKSSLPNSLSVNLVSISDSNGWMGALKVHTTTYNTHILYLGLLNCPIQNFATNNMTLLIRLDY